MWELHYYFGDMAIILVILGMVLIAAVAITLILVVYKLIKKKPKADGAVAASGPAKARYSEPAVGRGPSRDLVASGSNQSLDILREYKELLDMGAITQEEFDEKKAEILGL